MCKVPRRDIRQMQFKSTATGRQQSTGSLTHKAACCSQAAAARGHDCAAQTAPNSPQALPVIRLHPKTHIPQQHRLWREKTSVTRWKIWVSVSQSWSSVTDLTDGLWTCCGDAAYVVVTLLRQVGVLVQSAPYTLLSMSALGVLERACPPTLDMSLSDGLQPENTHKWSRRSKHTRKTILNKQFVISVSLWCCPFS